MQNSSTTRGASWTIRGGPVGFAVSVPRVDAGGCGRRRVMCGPGFHPADGVDRGGGRQSSKSQKPRAGRRSKILTAWRPAAKRANGRSAFRSVLVSSFQS